LRAPTRTPEDWLAALSSPRADRDYRPGHERVRALASACGLDRWRPRLRIRVVGTNGKGSTARFLATALQALGLRVGLYTSPHLVRFAERIAIDGRPVDDDVLLAALRRIVPHAEAIGASWFEAATVLALDCFAKAQVDVEILEAGVGARWDATTAFAAEMALIAPIGLDHCQWLGPTIEAIAEDKAHAFDGCRWCLTAPQPDAAMPALRKHAQALQVAPPWQGRLAAFGAFQRINAGLAWAAVLALRDAGWIPTKKQALLRAQKAIASTSIPGRMQRLCIGNAELWIDVAHNEHAAEAVAQALIPLRPWARVVVAVREDRDPKPIEQALAVLEAPIVRAATPEQAPQLAAQALLEGRVLVVGSHRAAGAVLAAFGGAP